MQPRHVINRGFKMAALKFYLSSGKNIYCSVCKNKTPFQNLYERDFYCADTQCGVILKNLFPHLKRKRELRSAVPSERIYGQLKELKSF